MKFLNLSTTEKWFTGITILIIAGFTFFNLQISIRKSRDFQRKEDVNNITKIVSMFQDKYGSLPASSPDGRIVGCNPRSNGKGGFDFEPCPWGDEIMPGVRVPVDPQNNARRSYRYIADGKRYQVYGSLESPEEPEYDPSVVKLNLSCNYGGTRYICNFGRAPEKVPVNMSLEEYVKTLPEELR
jgi:hypothetical protein